MPSFLLPSAKHCRDFLSHENAYVVHIPTGDDLYFTLPFDLDSLHPMRPQELETLHDFLDTIQDEVAENLGDYTLENMLQAQWIISGWLENIKCLSDLELQGWKAGHGFPVFDEFQHPIDFYWDWYAIEFEGLCSKYFKLVHPADTHHDFHSIHRTPPTNTFPPPNTPVNCSRYGSVNQGRMYSESGEPVIAYGATFGNTNELSEFLSSCTDDDTTLLQDRIIQLEGDSRHGICRVWGPHADLYLHQAPLVDVESIEPTTVQECNHETKDEAKTNFPWSLHSWEDFYQQGLISHDMTAEANTLMSDVDMYWFKLYTAIRDTGSSEWSALKIVRNIRRIEMSSLPEQPVWNNQSRWDEERSTYTFPDDTGYSTPQVITRQAMPHYHPGDFPKDHYCVRGGCMEQAQDPDQGSEWRVRTVQSLSSRDADRSTFTSHAEPHYVYSTQVPPTHRQSAMDSKRDSLLSSRRKSERMTQIKAAKKLPEPEKKERNRMQSEKEKRKALETMSAASEREKAKERALHSIVHQATHSHNHKQQSLSAQETGNKCKYNSESVHHQSSGPRRNIGINPDAYRTVSFQEPTRVLTRPRTAARPSSHHAGLNNSDRTQPLKSSYQAYAEDSPEDSPRAEPSSWRDV